jgi:hypothetical protein
MTSSRRGRWRTADATTAPVMDGPGELCGGTQGPAVGFRRKRVARLLRQAEHEVYAPTLTGLGERAHLMNRTINVDTHVQDIVSVIRCEELSDVVLCGQSYGGSTDRVQGRDRSMSDIRISGVAVGRGAPSSPAPLLRSSPG